MDRDTLKQLGKIPDPVNRAVAISRAITEHQDILQQAARMRRQAIAAARTRGYGTVKIAKAMGVTPGRVSQIMNGKETR